MISARACGLFGFGAIAIGGCGGSSTGTPTASVKAGLDACIVGTWKSTGSQGTVSSADGTIHIALTGGEGQSLVIRRDATALLVYDGSSPEKGTGTDGGAYVVTFTGDLTGTVRTAGNQLTFDTSTPDTATLRITKDGVVLQTTHAPPEQVSEYSCTTHKKLAVVTNGITTTFVPAAS